MIEKLESAGLGFYMRATETQQKLGTENVILDGNGGGGGAGAPQFLGFILSDIAVHCILRENIFI